MATYVVYCNYEEKILWKTDNQEKAIAYAIQHRDETGHDVDPDHGSTTYVYRVDLASFDEEELVTRLRNKSFDSKTIIQVYPSTKL